MTDPTTTPAPTDIATQAAAAPAGGVTLPAETTVQPKGGDVGKFSQADIDAAISKGYERGMAKLKADAEESAAKQRGEFERLYNDLKPKADRLPALEERAKGMLLATVPEAFRDLLPDGPLEAQLDWAQKAQAKGLFTPAVTPAPVKPTPAGQPTKPADAAASQANGAQTEPEPITTEDLRDLTAEKLANPEFKKRLLHQLTKQRRA